MAVHLNCRLFQQGTENWHRNHEMSLRLPEITHTLAKQSQHANTTHRNIFGSNMLRVFGHPGYRNMLGVVGSNLTIFKLEPTIPNTLQQGGQTFTTCCAQQCCDTLCWHSAFIGQHFSLHMEHLRIVKKVLSSHPGQADIPWLSAKQCIILTNTSWWA